MLNLKRSKLLSCVLLIGFFSAVLISGCGKQETTDNTTKENNKIPTEQSQSKEPKDSPNVTDKKNMEHIHVQVPTMQCDICKKNIETAVNKVDGIIDVNVDKKEKVTHVYFDRTKTDVAKIEASITAAGYNANDKKADPEAYKNLDDCCKLPKDRKEKSKQ